MPERDRRHDSQPDAADQGHRSGFVALVGRPNVGKSTLLNRLVGHKVSITAPTPQTTRTVLRGILTLPHAQVIFIDTPGIHRPKHRLGARMVDAARRAAADADVLLLVLDAGEGVTEEDRLVARTLHEVRLAVVAGVNKVDRVKTGAAARLEAEASDLVPAAAAVVSFSALRGTGLPRLVECLIPLLPEGPPLYPEEMVTDQPVQFLAREIIREKAIHLTRQEVPHAVAVEVEEFIQREGRKPAEEQEGEGTPQQGVTYIRATIHVERDGQKGILIGKEGRTLREIGRRSRQEVEALVGGKVYLDLWVKVSPAWREKESRVREFYPH